MSAGGLWHDDPVTLIAAADGSALGNPGPAGWAWYIDAGRWASGGWPHGTNNMGELTAVLDLLRQTAGLDDDLLIYCDSRYVINSITQWMPGWKRKNWRKGDGKPVLNVDIMKALDEALQGRRVRFEWVKGHSGHPLNEEADRLANAAAVAHSQGRRPVAGPGFVVDPSEPEPVPSAGSPAEATTQPDLTTTLPPAPDQPSSPSTQPAEAPAPARSSASGVPDEWYDADLFSMEPEPADDEHVIALERALLSDELRADPAAMAGLLHPDWYQVGLSGRLCARADLLADVAPLPHPVDLQVVRVERIAEDALLLLWRTIDESGSALGSSLWVRAGGDWVQRFQQATAEG